MRKTITPSVRKDITPITFSAQKTDKANAMITGLFFITATLTAIIGLKLYDPMLATSDYLHQASLHPNQITLGAIFELLVIAANCGTAIMLFPYLKAYNERLAFGYFTFRVFECVSIFLGVVSVLSLLTLSQSYHSGTNPDHTLYNAIGTIAKASHDWTFLLGPKFFLGINTFIYSYVFFRTGLVPRKLSVLGMTGAALVFINSLFTMFGSISLFSAVDIATVFPIAIYEMILAGWLIAKGFSIQYHSRYN
ncbi:MAG: DUF4386 domain-containing protein [Sphingobacteriales bacterium]|nr:MAG: DUF4386 domain-containing protein [Sphingobacteriales bacterium]